MKAIYLCIAATLLASTTLQASANNANNACVSPTEIETLIELNHKMSDILEHTLAGNNTLNNKINNRKNILKEQLSNRISNMHKDMLNAKSSNLLLGDDISDATPARAKPMKVADDAFSDFNPFNPDSTGGKFVKGLKPNNYAGDLTGLFDKPDTGNNAPQGLKNDLRGLPDLAGLDYDDPKGGNAQQAYLIDDEADAPAKPADAQRAFLIDNEVDEPADAQRAFLIDNEVDEPADAQKNFLIDDGSDVGGLMDPNAGLGDNDDKTHLPVVNQPEGLYDPNVNL